LLSRSDAITVLNDRDRQAIIDLNIDPVMIHTAPVTSHMPVHPLDAETKKRCRKAFDIPGNALCLAYFGFIHLGRHIDRIIEELSFLHEQGTPVFAIFLGAPAPGAENYYESCQILCEKRALTDQVCWTGYATAEQIADGLAATDIFVSLPDRGADMRNTSIHTAMLAQLPVVTLQNEGYYIEKQIVEMGCYTVDSPDAHRLCEKILEAYQNPPSGQFRQQLATWLDPERIWQQHIETNLRTYEGKPPESLAAFNAG